MEMDSSTLQPEPILKKPLPNITLRRFELADADDFMAWASDERVTRFARRDPYTSKEDALDYIKNTIALHPWYRAVCLVEDRRPIGSVSVKPAGSGGDGNMRRASIGYRLAYEYWGRGIGTAAVKAAAAAVFGEWPHLERLEAVADAENRASQKALEKAGFVREGVLRKYFLVKGTARDVVMYSFISTDDNMA